MEPDGATWCTQWRRATGSSAAPSTSHASRYKWRDIAGVGCMVNFYGEHGIVPNIEMIRSSDQSRL
jgi:hypothetical protein